MFALLRKTPLLLVSAFALMTASPVLAQGWDQRGWVQNEGQQQAYDRGYRKGVDQGREDAEDHRAFDYVRQKDYRKADDGYKGRYGNREWYANEFRRGYLAGYTQGYNNYARRYDDRQYRNDGYYGGGYYPNAGTYPNGGYYPNGTYGRAVPRGSYGYAVNPGYNRGYNDGLQKGSEDARKSRSYEPSRHGWYRSADRGYDRDDGPRASYEAAYRDGFMQGYAQAYRRGRY